ncbi:MAG: Mrp/NBP35 family ATP-binding protein [Pirellulales bacterium]|nr:Mrp/NBP35 family ATP-binding protein [Pirellulales bacterium]
MSQSPPAESAVREVLQQFPDPETGRSIVQLGQVPQCRVEDGRIAVTLGLTTWSAPLWEETCQELTALLKEKYPAAEVAVERVVHQRKPEKLGEIGLAAKTVIAVGSGKGGVGKSSIAAYLALGLARSGAQVGLLDADLYGPSIPHLLGSDQRPVMLADRIQPIVAEGLRVLSMGLLVPPGEAVIWRGPMLHSALTQFLRDTDWGELDYLIVDLPPGTGDVALSLSQLVPATGAVVVCTPQELALLDAVKAVKMFRQVKVEVWGMVENMSFFLCPNCQTRHEIFGSGGARKKAAELGVPFLGEVPLVPELRAEADAGRVRAALDHPQVRPYLEAICRRLVKNLSERNRQNPQLPTLTVLK